MRKKSEGGSPTKTIEIIFRKFTEKSKTFGKNSKKIQEEIQNKSDAKCKSEKEKNKFQRILEYLVIWTLEGLR